MVSRDDQPDTGKDLTGETIGDYLVLRRLGRGGMADVYLSRQLSLQRYIALKILRQDLARDSSYVDRFLREARAAAALVHANIVQIFEVGQHDGNHFIAQEYIPGQNLKMWMRRHGAIEPELAIQVLSGTAMAIQKADEFQVVHRDIKPENIMLSPSGEVKVTDFGLARINNDPSSQSLTKVGVTMGTPLYMSPEQVEGGSLDVRSDIYSLGVTMYHLLAGSPPFEGDNPLTIAMKQVRNQAKPLSEARPDLPTKMTSLIHRMIEKDPDQRPQDAAALIRKIGRIDLQQVDAPADSDSWGPQDRLSLPASPSLRRLQAVMQGSAGNRWVRTAGVAVVSAAMCVAAWFAGASFAQSGEPSDPLGQIALTPLEQEPVNRVSKRASVNRQYESVYWQTMNATDPMSLTQQERLWQSVIDYFPLNEAGDAYNRTKLYHQRAMERLGEIYLTQMRLDEADRVYESLANSGDLDRRFQVAGLVGKAIVLDKRSTEEFVGGRDEQESAIRRLLEDIGSDRELINPFLQKDYDKLLVRYPPYWTGF